MRKGSITVFMALILSLMVSLLCAGIESAQMAAARTQILNSLDIGLYSLFGQYDKTLLKDYDLFALDASSGGNNMNLAGVYDNLESYMEPVLRQNSQKLSVVQGGISGYRLLTDENGEVFYQQIVQYMKETLGSHGVQLLTQKMQDQKKKTDEAERAGTQAESGDTLTSYDSAMSQAAEKSQAALEEKRAMEQQQSQAEGFTDGGHSETEGFGGMEIIPQEVSNPIPAIQRVRWMGLLELVLPTDRGISDKKINKRCLVSNRTLEKGMVMREKTKADHSLTSQLLYQQYLMEKLGTYRNPGRGGLSCQIEYILEGKDSDEENVKAIAKKLLLIREGVNAASLAADSQKRAQVKTLSLAIASGFLIPPAAGIIEAALNLCWTFAESILDVRELFAGGKVPLVKDSSQWQISLENLPTLLDNLDSARKSDEKGLAYEDYLQILLMSEKEETKIKRGMDMVELSLRAAKGWENFRLDCCMTAMEASIDVKANSRKVFTVTRQYCYA